MTPLQPTRDAWVDVDPAEAETRYAHVTRLLSMADEAVGAQLRIISHDGERTAYTLALHSLELARTEHERELADLRRHRRREDIYFALDAEQYGKHGTSIDALGYACIGLQKLFGRVAQSRMTDKPAPAVPDFIKHSTRLVAEASFPSSFGLHLSVPTQAQTDGYSLILDTLEETFALLNNVDPAEVAARHGRYAFGAFKLFIESMIEHGVRPKATWRGLDGHEREWRPTDTRMTELHYKLERFEQRPAERKEETGILAGASTLSNKFEFVGEESGVVRGQVPRKLIEQVSACFNRRCRIWYEETQIHDPNTDRVKRFIKLLGAEPLTK